MMATPSETFHIRRTDGRDQEAGQGDGAMNRLELMKMLAGRLESYRDRRVDYFDAITTLADIVKELSDDWIEREESATKEKDDENHEK